MFWVIINEYSIKIGSSPFSRGGGFFGNSGKRRRGKSRATEKKIQETLLV